MGTTRSIKELLRIVLKNIDNHVLGLCHLVRQLYRNNIINIDELILLLNYIMNHRPNNTYKEMGSVYFWKRGEKKPRIEWLEKHIKRQSIIGWLKDTFKKN